MDVRHAVQLSQTPVQFTSDNWLLIKALLLEDVLTTLKCNLGHLASSCNALTSFYELDLFLNSELQNVKNEKNRL